MAKFRFLKVSSTLFPCPLTSVASFAMYFLFDIVSSFLQKQSDLLLNADDLDEMWVCLRENCVIDDATGAEKVRIARSISFILTF